MSKQIDKKSATKKVAPAADPTPAPSGPPAARTHSHLPPENRRTPISTYRLQLQPDFGFAAAKAALPTLQELGVTDLYLSPILQATPGSTHGYDVVDHSHISEDLGGREEFEALARAAHDIGMGVIVDVVPNHMSVPTPLWNNHALWSLLRDGSDSKYAEWFDGADPEQRILMPVLGSRIGAVLANQELQILDEVIPGDTEPSPVLRYYDHVFPIKEGTENLPLAELVQAQNYRLAYWKVASEELNYRRFFDVDTLAALRIEDREVFDATHALLLELFDQGHIDGFRIDHPDGLANPGQYFEWMDEATGGAWVVAEKILEADESLPKTWEIAGTTGYDAAWRVGSLYVDPSSSIEMNTLAQKITDSTLSLAQEIERGKREIAASSLYAEIYRITNLAQDICRDDIRLRDHTFRSLEACLTEMIIALDRYRAYVIPGEDASPEAERVIMKAAEIARGRLDPDYHDTLDVVIDLVLGREVGSAGRVDEAQRWELIVRFQQVCGAVMAKGVEDTAYYRWTPLVSLSEVGGAPQDFGSTPDMLHDWAKATTTQWPATMTLLSTHDAKRSEDVRAKIGAISQYSTEWAEMIDKIDHFAEEVEGHTRNVLWQTLAGTWEDGPIDSKRLVPYMIKVAREQKLWTSWTAQNVEAEEALERVCEELLENEEVLERFEAWHKLTARSSRSAILGQKALQLTIPGVADVYQGTERLQNYLVDPDNRDPLNVEELQEQLAEIDSHSPRDLSQEKLALTRAILQLRRRVPEAFVGPDAHYRPLATSTGHLVAFSRGADPVVVTVASRLLRSLNEHGGLRDHTVVFPDGLWKNVYSGVEINGGEQSAASLLKDMPVAVFERIGDALPRPSEDEVDEVDETDEADESVEESVSLHKEDEGKPDPKDAER